MKKTKIIHKKTGIVYEVKESLAGDYIGTKEFELLKNEIKVEKSDDFKKNDEVEIKIEKKNKVK